MMKKSRVVIRLLGAVALVLLLSGCFESQKQPRAYVSDLTSGDSVSIKMGQYTLLKYHSDRLGMDINYPSCFPQDFVLKKSSVCK